MNRFIAALAGAASLILPGAASAQSEDVCKILASRLQPDVLQQGSISQQFSQLKQLMQDQRYEDFGSASSSQSSFSLGFSIPDEVDLAIGDGQKSNSSNWGSRRSQFLSMNFQQTSSSFRSSTFLSEISVAALHEIVRCANILADANGVFVVLDQISPVRDSFTVQVTLKTSGDPSTFALTDFHVDPPDPNFTCGSNGFEKASRDHPLKLPQLKTTIGCSKSPKQHLNLVVQTTEGGAKAIVLTSIDEQIQQLREDFQSQLQAQAAQMGSRIGALEKALGSFDRFVVVQSVVNPSVAEAPCPVDTRILSASCVGFNPSPQAAVGPRFDFSGAGKATCNAFNIPGMPVQATAICLKVQ